MLRLSNLADYAVVALVELARADSRLAAPELAERTGIAVPTVAKLTGMLTRAGLLAATRGVGGGVELARSAQRIRLTDIVEAVDGPIGLTTCLHENASDCAIGSLCAVRPHWPLINARVREALAEVTLADLTKRQVEPV